MKFKIKAEDVAAFRRNNFTITKQVQYFAVPKAVVLGKTVQVHSTRKGDKRLYNQCVTITAKKPIKFRDPKGIVARVCAATRDFVAIKANRPATRTKVIEMVAKRTGLTAEQVGPAISTLVHRHGYLAYKEK